jgi:hypothetical protein
MSAEPRSRPAPPRRAQPASRTAARRILGDEEASLLDVVDNVLNKGVVVTGEITIALAQVDLIYARLSLLLCAADRVLPADDPAPTFRRRARRARRLLTNRGV